MFHVITDTHTIVVESFVMAIAILDTLGKNARPGRVR